MHGSSDMRRLLVLFVLCCGPATARAATKIKALHTFSVSGGDSSATAHSGKNLSVLERELSAALAPLHSKKAAELRGLAGLIAHGTVHSVDGPHVVNVKSLLRARRQSNKRFSNY